MRITNKQKNELNIILKEIGLDKSRFEFSGDNDKHILKFRENYFTYHIVRKASDKYNVNIKSVSNQAFRNYVYSWKELAGQFKIWCIEILEDIKHDPNKSEIIEVEFPSTIKRFSKRFVQIYNEAYTSEQSRLLEICGLGYRKAFEVLIKDYLIKKNEKNEHDEIKKLPVSKCIDKYITDDGVKLLAKRVFWLGNDHAHYVKKWKGKTLQDLKDLIDLSIRWIQIHEELIKIEKSMPKGK